LVILSNCCFQAAKERDVPAVNHDPDVWTQVMAMKNRVSQPRVPGAQLLQDFAYSVASRFNSVATGLPVDHAAQAAE
jgi:hypothetical protein